MRQPRQFGDLPEAPQRPRRRQLERRGQQLRPQVLAGGQPHQMPVPRSQVQSEAVRAATRRAAAAAASPRPQRPRPARGASEPRDGRRGGRGGAAGWRPRGGGERAAGGRPPSRPLEAARADRERRQHDPHAKVLPQAGLVRHQLLEADLRPDPRLRQDHGRAEARAAASPQPAGRQRARPGRADGQVERGRLPLPTDGVEGLRPQREQRPGPHGAPPAGPQGRRLRQHARGPAGHEEGRQPQRETVSNRRGEPRPQDAPGRGGDVLAALLHRTLKWRNKGLRGPLCTGKDRAIYTATINLFHDVIIAETDSLMMMEHD